MSDELYRSELARALERREAERIDRRARMLLQVVGWDATREQVERAIDNADGVVVLAGDRDAVIARATQLQAEEGGGEHRYDAKQIEAYMASRPKGTRAVPKQAQRDEIRRYVAELLEQEPRPSRMKMLEAVNAKFGVQLTIGNLDMTYLPGARQVNERKRADMTQQQRGLVVNAKSVAEVDGGSQAPAEGVRAEQRSPVTGNARQGTGEAAPASSPEPNPLDNALRAAADYAVRRNGRADPTHGPVFLTQFVFGGRTRITIDVILPAGSGLRLMAAAALVLAEHPEVLNG